MRISIEGTVVETALDVYKVIGRYNALNRVYQMDVTDGFLNIVFEKNGGSRNPMVSAIDVEQITPPTPMFTPTPTATPSPTITPGGPTFTPTITPSPSPTAPLYEQRVNAGGQVFMDTQGNTWAADQAYAVNGWGYTSGTAKSTTTAVNGTSDDGLYQKWRDAPIEYRFTVPNGTYKVTLKLAEFSASKSGSRVMKVQLESSVVDPTLDVYALIGKATALDRNYTVTVNDGILNMAFTKVSGTLNPMAAAIYVRSASLP